MFYIIKNCTSLGHIVMVFKIRRFILLSPKMDVSPICRPNQVAEVENIQNCRNIFPLFPSLQCSHVYLGK